MEYFIPNTVLRKEKTDTSVKLIDQEEVVRIATKVVQDSGGGGAVPTLAEVMNQGGETPANILSLSNGYATTVQLNPLQGSAILGNENQTGVVILNGGVNNPIAFQAKTDAEAEATHYLPKKGGTLINDNDGFTDGIILTDSTTNTKSYIVNGASSESDRGYYLPQNSTTLIGQQDGFMNQMVLSNEAGPYKIKLSGVDTPSSEITLYLPVKEPYQELVGRTSGFYDAVPIFDTENAEHYTYLRTADSLNNDVSIFFPNSSGTAALTQNQGEFSVTASGWPWKVKLDPADSSVNFFDDNNETSLKLKTEALNGTNRVITLPDADGTIALLSDITGGGGGTLDDVLNSGNITGQDIVFSDGTDQTLIIKALTGRIQFVDPSSHNKAELRANVIPGTKDVAVYLPPTGGVLATKNDIFKASRWAFHVTQNPSDSADVTITMLWSTDPDNNPTVTRVGSGTFSIEFPLGFSEFASVVLGAAKPSCYVTTSGFSSTGFLLNVQNGPGGSTIDGTLDKQYVEVFWN